MLGELFGVKFIFNAYATKKNEFHKKFNKNTPVPMRVMFGTIVRETDKCYVIEVCGKPEPTTHCLHCQKPLTNKVSMYYGLGPVCGAHYYIIGITEKNLESKFEDIRKRMNGIKWKGLIPKNQVQLEHENLYVLEFMYNGQKYRTQTSDLTRLNEIRNKADKVISETSTQM